jgi:hypothetical protein
VDIGAAFVADDQTAKAMEPGEGSFHHPAMAPETLRGLDAAPSDARGDPASATSRPRRARVVALVGVQLVGTQARPSDRLLDGRYAVEQGLEQSGVGHVRAAQLDGEGDALAVDKDVVLGARPAAVGRIRTDSIRAPLFAAIFEPSIAARDQSIVPCAPSSSSTRRCNFGQMPASVQSRRRRQQVTPEPQFISRGNMRHWMPVRSTNKIPVIAARSGTRGRPPSGFGRCGGSNGFMRSHSASDTRGFAMGPTTYPSIQAWAKF